MLLHAPVYRTRPSVHSYTRVQVLAGSDLFLPIFMLVLARANLRCPFGWILFLKGCCSPDQMKGEAGFYLTTFEGALDCIAAAEGVGVEGSNDEGGTSPHAPRELARSCMPGRAAGVP